MALNSAFGPIVTRSATAGGGTVNVIVPAVGPNQNLLILEIRPSESSNNFDFSIFKDPGRTKTIYKVTGITTDEFVVQDYVQMILDGNMYFTIINNNVSGSRTYTIEGVAEVDE